jgi:hypothetical protein
LTPGIAVRCEPAADAWVCHVEVTESGSRSAHEVMVSAAELARLAPGADDPTDLVTRSFTFLLAREPKEAILGRFAISVIGRYFPEYEDAIRRS